MFIMTPGKTSHFLKKGQRKKLYQSGKDALRVRKSSSEHNTKNIRRSAQVKLNLFQF
jgi:hypothetical protein